MTKINFSSLEEKDYDYLLDECSEINNNRKLISKQAKEKRKLIKENRKKNLNEVVD